MGFTEISVYRTKRLHRRQGMKLYCKIRKNTNYLNELKNTSQICRNSEFSDCAKDNSSLQKFNSMPIWVI